MEERVVLKRENLSFEVQEVIKGYFKPQTELYGRLGDFRY
jgi:hypothetical protein